jgi:hypothetical protein
MLLARLLLLLPSHWLLLSLKLLLLAFYRNSLQRQSILMEWTIFTVLISNLKDILVWQCWTGIYYPWQAVVT